jgi:hypothetical protein
MLYDKRWEITKDVFSLESLIAWLETMPGRYNYQDINQCAGCKYFRAMGLTNVLVGRTFFCHGEPRIAVDLPRGFNDIFEAKPHTYGAALDRARTTLSKGEGGKP